MMEKHTQKDPNQVITAEHSDEYNAKKVVIVGGSLPEIKLPDTLTINTKSPDIQVIKVPTEVIVKQIEIKEIQVPQIVIQKEIQIEKVPVITTEYKTIEVPIVHKELVMVDKPVVVTEFKEKDLPIYLKVLLAVQSLGIIILLIKSILK